MKTTKYDISVIIPIFNEEDSLELLVNRLIPVLKLLGSHEIIFVNDGSSDKSESILDAFGQECPNIIKVIHLRTNCGKSIALRCGFREASGELIVMMDADLQDNHEEIPKLVNYLRQNKLDMVTGWKFNRYDPASKRLPSRLFNYVVCRFSGLKIHDFNCGLKVMHHECLKDLRLYGQLHRFLVVLIARQGFKVGECKVEHSPRKYGHSKYGAKRIYEGLMDFLTIFFLTRYQQSPLYFFGFYGLLCFLFSFLYGAFFVGLHFFSLFTHYPQGHLSQHPLWLLSPVIFLAGIIFIFFGLIGELIYYIFSIQLNQNYIQRQVGFGQKSEKE
ncbi:MAG: glycosyltransferase family 2 protein [Candidatus Omnitrophica bacterium]|nr:glycosyltransferase family 2 protein [Candidatus Omnitrophota bacterium]